jgi:signal peptidase I
LNPINPGGCPLRLWLEEETMDRKRFIKEYLEPIVIAVLIALFIRTFVIQAFKIPSGSMEPTLQVGDHILVSKFIYGIKIPFTNVRLFQFNKPQRGDIIVFIFPKDRSKDFIKRVVGVGGEKVEIVRNKIYINDKLIVDPWGHFNERNDWIRYFQSMESYGPKIIPKDSLFVLGDNRDNSQDSRFWDFVKVNAVKGKALVIYFSWNGKAGGLLDKIRWGRFGKLLH